MHNAGKENGNDEAEGGAQGTLHVGVKARSRNIWQKHMGSDPDNSPGGFIIPTPDIKLQDGVIVY